MDQPLSAAAAPAEAGAPRDAAAADLDAKVANLPPGAIDEFRTTVLLAAEKQMREKLDLEIPIEVDFRRLLVALTAQENQRLLDKLRQDVFSNWFYWVREVNEKLSLNGRVSAIRIEGAASAAQRALFADESRLIYHINLVESDGFHYAGDLDPLVLGVVAGMPERIDPRKPRRVGRSDPPTRDSAALVADYEQRIVPELTRRLTAILQRDVKVEGDWKAFAASMEQAAGLLCWGLQRVCGAAGLLMLKSENKAVLPQSWSAVRIISCDRPEQRHADVENGTLSLAIHPAAGEAGAFYETEIADALTRGLGLATRPVIESLRAEAATWEQRLDDLFGRPIRYDIDWTGFTSHPELQKNMFALQLLREHGIDHLYYAISGLAEKNPNFKQQFANRVETLRLRHVPDPKQKSLDPGERAVVYKLALHDGYQGYLTIPELEKRIAAAVAEMPDAGLERFIRDPRTGMTTQEEESRARLESVQRAEDQATPDETGEEEPDEEESDQPQTADEQPQNAPFLHLQAEMQVMLPTYAQQLQAMIGKAIPLEIDWSTLDNRIESIGELLNGSLTPVLGGFAFLGQDSAMRQAVEKFVDRLVIRKAAGPAQHGFSLSNGLLTFSAFLSPGMPVLDPQRAAGVLRAIFATAAERGPSTPKEPTAAPKRKAATKRPAAKKSSKRAPKKNSEKKSPPRKPKRK